jgi:ribose 5-phosphate isomerase B
MRIAIGSDHAGFEYKEGLKNWLKQRGYDVNDFGSHNSESSDYADFAHPVANDIDSKNSELGVLVCGSANGVAITANKHQSIRAAICWNEELASLARRHNDANVVCIPARFIPFDLAEKILDTFLKEPFEGGRHARRVGKISC